MALTVGGMERKLLAVNAVHAALMSQENSMCVQLPSAMKVVVRALC